MKKYFGICGMGRPGHQRSILQPLHGRSVSSAAELISKCNRYRGF